MTHNKYFQVALGDRGRLVLPAPLRRSLNLRPGDRLLIVVEPDGGFRVVTARDQAARLSGLYADVQPERSLTEELIAERRREARREEEF